MKTIWFVCAGYVCGLIAGWAIKAPKHWMSLAFALGAVIAMTLLGVASALHDGRKKRNAFRVSNW